jgi:hypothetical protein
MKKNSFAIVISFMSLMFFLVVPAFAVDEYGLFDLEQGLGAADAEDSIGNNSQFSGVDWETMCEPNSSKECQTTSLVKPGGSSAFSGIISDPDGTTIFGGGNKDIHDVSAWSWGDGAVPDKSDLLHAAAAAYDNSGELVIYYTADRFDNVGNTYMGFWFFQDEVAINNGGFSGNHKLGDVLVLVNFPQATNAVPLVQSLKWDPTCPRKDNNNPQPGQCAATNLRLLSTGVADGAVCVDNGNPGEQLACANTNDGLRNSPWNYTSKNGDSMFPFETFFEGGINISQLLGGEACFASFMAETRASSSFTAQLKDFVLGAFPLCGIEVGKLCYANTPIVGSTPGSAIYTYDVAGCIENDGFGKVTNLDLVDNPSFDLDTLEFWTVDGTLPTDAECGYGTEQGDFTALDILKSTEITDPATYELEAGKKVIWFAQFTSDVNGDSDTVTASATTTSGSTIPDATDSANCPSNAFTPGLAVTKNCDAGLASLDLSGGGTVAAVKVEICGAVSNPGAIRLLAVSVNDNHAGAVYNSSSLANAGSAGYTGGYYPSGVTSTLPPYNFSDEVTAVGYVEAGLVKDPPAYCRPVTLSEPPAVGSVAGLPAGDYYACTVTDPATCDVCDTAKTCPIPATP